MSEPQERQEGEERFFSVKQKEDKDKRESIHSSLNQSTGSDKVSTNRCLTLRAVQYLLPCLRKKGVWEPSQGDVFKSHDTDETKYPKTLRILENKIFDVIFVCSCLLSIYLFLFSEGFLIESRVLWGIIHLVNAIYAMGLFSQWLQILIKSKYAKTNHGYTTQDIVYTLLSVFPADLIVLAIFTLNYDEDNDDEEATNPIEYWMITVSRLNYFLRVRSILQYLSKWEDNLAVGDFKMFMLRTFLFSSFLLHMFTCVWHRLACNSFKLKHFYMTPDEATVDSCRVDSWIGLLKTNKQVPLLDHPDWHVLFTHYFVSMYWAIIATFRMGAGDIKTSLVSDLEKAFVSVTEITAWIFVLASVSGTLTSLLIEKDTEKENFLTRLFSIRTYLSYGKVSTSVQHDVTRFYQYLWAKSKGILNLDLVDLMPNAMKAAVYYDINKFVLDQLPILKDLEAPLLMSLSVHTKHRFHMKGEILFKKNEVACGMYYVVKGHLEVLSDDEKHVIVTIRSGSVIGEVHLLQPYPHLTTVRCGSDCDILVLTRKHFRRVLNTYPQYIPTLEQTLETRLEETGLLLALAEKHNTYHKVFRALREMHNNEDTGFHDQDLDHHSFENVMKVLEPHAAYEDGNSLRTSEDLDGLNVTQEMEERLLHRSTVINKAQPRYEELVQAALAAIEADVTRAGSLALDLEIHVPPLFVSAPEAAIHVTLGFNHQKDSENIFVKLGKCLKDPRKGNGHMLWKFIVSVCALLAFWYYLYQFAFRDLAHVKFDYYMHLTDLIFLSNCIYDMMQIVVTPQRSFESAKDIAMYRFRSFYFYLRIFSWLPFEYLSARLVGYGRSLSPWFYFSKFNRLVEVHLVFRFLSEFETRSNISPTLLFIGKYVLGLFFVSHIFTVIYMFVLRDINSNPTIYSQAYYWAIIVVTSAGFGDRRATTDAEVAAEVLGLMIGVSTVLFMGAKLSAILVNTERRRMSFKQTYYGLLTFMKQRKFPKPLWNRVCDYYKLQWHSHEGTLIPTDRPVIWDAPKVFTVAVSHAQIHKYVSRIPLFMHASIDVQNEMAIAFKQYIIPPGEVLLYPGELVQDLYIISEGHCEVIYRGKTIAVFSAGRYFGLSGLLFGINTEYKFKTITHCRIFCLDHANFVKTAQKKPRFYHDYKLLTSEEELSLYETMNEDQEVSELNYPSEQFLDELVKNSTAETVNDNENESYLKSLGSSFKKSSTNFCFLPNGLCLKWWLIFRVTAALIVTIFAPAQAFFSIHPQTSFRTILAFDIIAWIDIVISMRVAYLGPEQQLVTSTCKMATHYITGPFLLDVLASFPADYILYQALSGDPAYYHLYYLVSLLRLNRMIQCYKLVLVCRLLEKTIFRSLTFVMLLEMMPVMLLFMNITTCLSVYAVCDVSYDGQPIVCKPDAWIINGIQSLDYSGALGTAGAVLTATVRNYIIGLYWIVQTAMCVGFGDIDSGTSTMNQGVVIAVIFIGVIVTSYIGGKLTSCIVGDDPARIALQDKMTLMHEYLQGHRVGKNARRRVQETYFNIWNKMKGVSPTALFTALPPTLKTDVLRQLYEPSLRSSPIFQNLDGPGIRILSTSLTEMFYPEGEFLMKFGDLSNEVFLVAKGIVVCYNIRGDIMSQLGPGSLIGEIAAVFNTHRLYSAIAVKDVTAYVFRRDFFMHFLSLYPDLKKVLELCSVKHYKEAMGSKKTGNQDFDVLLTYQNEIDVHQKQPKASQDSQNDDDQSKRETMGSLALGQVLGQDNDITRNVLQEDLFKTAEDFSKGSVDKWWSVFVTFGRRARDEMGLVHIYQELGQVNIFNFIIHPASSVCSWVSFCLLLTAMSCSVTAYEIAFYTESAITSATLPALRYTLECFFVVRILGNFHLGYYDETANLIVDVRTISRRYACKMDGLVLDLITTFPFYLISYFTSLKSEYMRGVRLLRVFLFVRYLNETDSDLKMKASRVKILKITILLCFIFHFWACAWYLVACYQAVCTRGSWMDKTLKDLGLSPSDVTITSRYLLSLYYVTTALTYTGFADITGRTTIELSITIVMIFVTVFLIGYLLGEMTQCLASQVATKIHYQHKLSILESHYAALGLSSTKIDEVRHYFKLLWCRCKGVMLYSLMEELPYPLRADVAMEIYGPNLKSSRLLGKLDDNLIRQISAKIRHEIYFPGSHIVRAGDVCTSMYFIKKGEIVILDGNSNLELCVEVLYENECFGEVKILLPREQYRFSYIARLESEVGVLFKDDLDEVLKSHPRVFDDLREKANRVKSRRQSIKEDEERGVGNLSGGVSSMSIKSAPSQAVGGASAKALAETT